MRVLPKRRPRPHFGLNAARLIIGLGNPGAKYRNTRHNAGFMAVDQLAAALRANWRLEKKFASELTEVNFADCRILLAKPQTFMNLSGGAVVQLVRFFRIELSKILIVVDDADLPMGTLRLRPGGSAGGHHGLESIEQHVGSREFARLKLGIARPASGQRDIAGHVLGCFEGSELGHWKLVLERAAQQLECWVTGDVAKAMNDFNGVVTLPLGGLNNAERKMQ